MTLPLLVGGPYLAWQSAISENAHARCQRKKSRQNTSRREGVSSTRLACLIIRSRVRFTCADKKFHGDSWCNMSQTRKVGLISTARERKTKRPTPRWMPQWRAAFGLDLQAKMQFF